ncbi:MAG TPA: nucleoside-diphosphate kinase [Candidatus Nanoarchaeia archaeon]|nr:nucleoside-diphosphate kinase [Candidatus Nanoarchaeia archaeon]
MERTLIIFKPDAVQRGLVGEILTRFEKAGLKIVGMKMVRPSTDEFFHHYETIGKMVSRRGQEIFDMTLDYVGGGPVIMGVLEGVDAVAIVRKLRGDTEPKSALPGTISGDYAHVNYAHADSNEAAIANLLHASGDSAEAKEEVAHWFNESELHDYKTVHEYFTQPKKR